MAQVKVRTWPGSEEAPGLQRGSGHSSSPHHAGKQHLPLSSLMELLPHPAWGLTGVGLTPSKEALSKSRRGHEDTSRARASLL